MSDTFENIFGGGAKKDTVCRVAYTLNNQQPVICTIIDDQPLFYMDYDYIEEEEGLFNLEEMEILEKEIKNLETFEAGHESIERFSSDFVQTPEEKFSTLMEDKAFITSQFSEDTQYTIEDLRSVIQMSRLGEAFIAFADDHAVTFKYSDQIEHAYYDRVANSIFVNPVISFDEQLHLLTRELRRHWQFRQGALINPLMFHPDHAILINRAQVADLSVVMIRVAWELQLSGYKGAWKFIENSSLADLGRAFAKDAFLDFRKINNGDACLAVFEEWFMSERCLYEDKKLINHMLVDVQGYVFDLEEAKNTMTPALLTALGTLPYGKNYLASFAGTIIQDPIFTDVRDRSNANFLWFIKFERSFRETEHMLQQQESAEDIRSSLLQSQDRDLQHGTQQNEIVTLFTNGSGQPSKECAPDREGSCSAEIIYLRAKPTE